MSKQLIIALTDTESNKYEDLLDVVLNIEGKELRQEHQKLSYEDCPRIWEEFRGKDIDPKELSDAFDLIVGYLIKERSFGLSIGICATDAIEDDAEEMTLKEIEEALGHRIKIVDEKEEE